MSDKPLLFDTPRRCGFCAWWGPLSEGPGCEIGNCTVASTDESTGPLHCDSKSFAVPACDNPHHSPWGADLQTHRTHGCLSWKVKVEA